VCVIWLSLQTELLPENQPDGGVLALSISRDGSDVLLGGVGTSAQIWDVASGKELAQLKGIRPKVTGAAVSPDGFFALTTDLGQDVHLWKVSTRQLVRDLKGFTKSANCVAWFPDGQHVVAGSDDNTLRIWNASTGETLQTFTGHPSAVTTVAVSPQGDRLVSGCHKVDPQMRLWDAKTGQKLSEFGPHPNGVSSVAFSADDQFALSGSLDGIVRRWNLNRPQDTPLQMQSTGQINAVAFVPGKSGNARMASASILGRVCFWDDNGKLVGEWRLPGAVSSLAFTPDGQHVLTGNSNGTVYVLRMPPPPPQR
jgi:WD40 repeat protein